MRTLKRVATLLLLGLGVPAVLQATTLIKLSTEQMTERASDIVIGTVTEMRSVWVDRALVTLATISVSESLKGSKAREVTLALPGGVDANRAVPIAVTYPGAPMVSRSESVLLFLESNAAVANAKQVVGYSQGKYSLVRDAFGRTLASPTRGLNLDAVELSNFKQQIRNAVKARAQGNGDQGGNDNAQ